MCTDVSNVGNALICQQKLSGKTIAPEARGIYQFTQTSLSLTRGKAHVIFSYSIFSILRIKCQYLRKCIRFDILIKLDIFQRYADYVILKGHILFA
ncbi:hypothetical protein PUN28_001752 [Cardiocondyla obscurior]|uniref:Uncharacterized protein n=1 Tax=Cardiocondyla obscurior TaxID=286306 RepID=A0AAW2GR31_9HYME